MCLDSNPRPLVCESPIITTTPCLTTIVGELLANKINNEDNATNKPKILPLTVKCVYDGDLLLAELECPRALATP